MINSTGAALMWPLTTIFVHQQLGRSLADAGFVIMMQMLGGMLGQFAGGSMYYKLGIRKLLIGSLALAGLLQASLVFTAYNDWWSYIITMALIGFTTNMSMPAIQSFIGFQWPERRDELFNSVYVANNIGVALGTAISGVLADISFNLTFLINAASSVGFAVFFYYYLRRMEIKGPDNSSRGQSQDRAASSTASKVYKQPAHVPETGAIPALTMWDQLKSVRLYLFLSVGAMLIWLANSMWGSGVAPHLTDQGMEMKMYSWLWTINGIIIFLGQPITNWIKRTIARPITSQLTWSAVFYCIAYGIIWIIPSYPGFVFGMLIATLGEMLVSPAVPAFLAARTGRQAPFYMGVAGGISSVGRMIGPYVLGIAYDGGGLDAVVIVSIIIGAMSVISFAVHAYLHRESHAKEYIHTFDT
ncbi:MFS transporter [Paenibacillus marinisediminis]